jgi:riboflavin kinase / FMN adenylyltransferase
MKVYRGLEEFSGVKNAVVTTGTFDGVHVGHRKIISRLKETAAQINGESVILTFFPHPRLVLFPEDNDLKLINTLSERIELLDKAGIDHLVVIPFTKEFSRLTSVEFIQKILVEKIQTKKLVIGYDHHFGKNREGSFEHLKQYSHEYGFTVEEIPEQDINDVAVSSTKIRAALLNGDIKTADIYLGYPFSIEGKVIRGDQIGRQIGYPTANISIEENYKLIPGDGIYAVKIFLSGDEYKGMLYIGNRPVVNGQSKSIEVYIFDFDQNIYDQPIKAEFHHFIRNDMELKNLEQLKEQLREDEIMIRKFFSK